MKFLSIFRFEFTLQLRSPWTWLILLSLTAFAFLFVRVNFIADALFTDFFVNSPFIIASATVISSIIWLLAAPVIAGEAAARDVSSGMYPLTYTVPTSKFAYLGGRLLAAICLNMVILLGPQAGILLSIYLPGVDPAIVGPFRPEAHLTAYLYVAVSTAVVATAIQFSMASVSGKALTSYLGSLLLIFMAFFVASLLLFHYGIGSLLDPIGIRFIVEDLARLWTNTEKNWRLLTLESTLLNNRMIWLAVASVFVIVAYLQFTFKHRRELHTRWRFPLLSFKTRRTTASRSDIGRDVKPGFAAEKIQLNFSFAGNMFKIFTLARASFTAIAKSWAGMAMLIIIPLLTIPVLLDQMQASGVSILPTTTQVLRELTAPLSDGLSRWVIIPLLMIFFAGELVWREKEAKLDEINDALPFPDWVPFLGKFLALALMLAMFLTLQIAAGMLAQIMMDHHNLEFGLYLKTMLGLQFAEYLLFTLLALVLHVVIGHKYVAHLAAALGYAYIVLPSLFGVEHNLLIYGAGPAWSYTDIRGFGSSIAPWMWFKLYWAAWGILLAVAARLLWVRGRKGSLVQRLQEARHRLSGTTTAAGGAGLFLVFCVGGFIFYNTNLLNKYVNESGKAEISAEYERRYSRYGNLPQPATTNASLRIELFPEERSAEISGTYLLVNTHKLAIDRLHISTAVSTSDVKTREISFDKPFSPVLNDQKLGYRIFVLQDPLAPGDTLRFEFKVDVKPRGFQENGIDPALASNGTYFSTQWLPTIGYQPSRELLTAKDRRDHSLDPRPIIASLYESDTKAYSGGGIMLETIIGTSADQTAVAPGQLLQSWTAPAAGSGVTVPSSRRYFHYSTSKPIGNEWSFFSARYTMHEELWSPPKDSLNPGLNSTAQTVTIRVFHHPDHSQHLARLLSSIRASLDYYSIHFGPYRFNHLTAVEAPANGTGMHADASMLTYAEGFALWTPKTTSGNPDFPFAVVAHEVAHQWTVPYAFVEGAPVMSESIAWYYCIKAVENALGPDELQRLMSTMRQPNPIPPIRRGEPLLRGLDPYMAYRKGPFALYTLSEYAGEEQVNAALRRLLDKHSKPGSQLATTLDLYRELKMATPDTLHYLLNDLFEKNTFWSFQLTEASATQLQDNQWEVRLELHAKKLVFDSAGVESELQMDEWVEIGVFEHGKGKANPQYLQKHRIHSGEQSITIKVPRKPAFAGVDPYHLLDWEESGDDNNTMQVNITKPGSLQ